MLETTCFDRWAVATAALFAVFAVCALALPSGQGVAAPAAAPTNTAEPKISGRAEQGRTLSAVARIMERYAADLVRVPVGALRRRRRSAGRRRLLDRLGGDESGSIGSGAPTSDPACACA